MRRPSYSSDRSQGRERGRRREPERIGDVVSRLLARTGYARELTRSTYAEIWAEAAGPAMAKDSRPGRIRRGVLEVIVRNSTVLHELTFRKQPILRQICQRLPSHSVQDLRFRVGEID